MEKTTRAQNILDYYDSDDFKGNYWDCLLQDSHQCIDRIIELAKDYETEHKYGTSFDLTRAQAEAIYNYLKENLDSFVSSFDNYWVGYTSVDGVSFGEQEEQLTDFWEPNDHPEALKAIQDEFEEAGFYVSGNSAYKDLSDSGIHVDLLNADIPLLIELAATLIPVTI
jgi:hypothetical protein